MTVLNYEKAEINVKILYYGPFQSGKSTNIYMVHKKLKPSIKSKLQSEASARFRRSSFDFLPDTLGDINGFKIRFIFYSVSGLDIDEATLLPLLKGADGIVFVMDSRQSVMQKNMESLINFEKAMKQINRVPGDVPCVIQYNKRDLPEAGDLEDMHSKLNKIGMPFFPAVAVEGKGVMETSAAICRLVVKKLIDRFQKGGMKELDEKEEKIEKKHAPRPQSGFGIIPDDYSDAALEMLDSIDITAPGGQATATPPPVKLTVETKPTLDITSFDDMPEDLEPSADVEEIGDEEDDFAMTGTVEKLPDPGASKPGVAEISYMDETEFEFTGDITEDEEYLAESLETVAKPFSPNGRTEPSEEMSIEVISSRATGNEIEVPIVISVNGSEKRLKLKIRIEPGDDHV